MNDAATPAAMPDNAAIADAFDELAARLELAGEQRYRVQAWRRAADSFRELHDSLAVLAREGRLQELPGVGPAIASGVRELVEHGTFEALERARAEVPDVLLELVRLPGIGTKTARAIVAALAPTELADVAHAARRGELADVAGVGAKAITTLAALADSSPSLRPAAVPADGPWYRRDQAQAAATALDALLPRSATVHVGGLLARGGELVDRADVVVAGCTVDELVSRCVERGWSIAQRPAGDHELASFAATVAVDREPDAVLRSPGGLPVHAWIAASDAELALLVELVTSPPGWAECSTDESCLSAIAVELRDRVRDGELSPAVAAHLSSDLVQLSDLRGELHSHSDWSDGRASIEQMARAARERGCRWHVVTDHSAPYALVGGLDGERLEAQAAEIERVNAELEREAEEEGAPPLRVLHGIEVEILPDGSLGLPDEVLARLDWVVASIHQAQQQSRDELARRMRRVLANPLVDCIGHPTGRLLLRRPPMALDIALLVDLAAEHGVALEINANPRRLDLAAEHAALAVAAGAALAIDSDAHAPQHLDFRVHGIAVARRAGVTRDQVVNCCESWDEVVARRRRNAS